MKHRTLLIILLCLLGLPMSCFAKQKNDRAKVVLQYIDKGKAPFDYIADKLRSHKIVAIGEDHWIADHSEFLCDVLRNVGYTADTHISNLALEFGNERDQMLADSLAFGKKWNEAFANKILLDAPDVLEMIDYCDGFIFVKPVKDFSGMQLIDIYDDVWVATLADRIDPPPARTKEEIFKTILEWHPTCLPLIDK